MIPRSEKETEHTELLDVLETRFNANMERHEGMDWTKIRKRLETILEKIQSLHWMEETGGEPDVVDFDPKTGEYVFVDCSRESPTGRRNLPYRNTKEKEECVEKQAKTFGVSIIERSRYTNLSIQNNIDPHTDSWLATPSEILETGLAFSGHYDKNSETVWVNSEKAGESVGYRDFRAELRV